MRCSVHDFAIRYDESVISQNFQHRFVTLLFGKEFGGVFAVFVFVDDDHFRGWNQTVLNAAVTAQRFLVCAHVEESDVLFVVGLEFGHEHGVRVGFGVVVIFAVAGEAA